MILSQKQLQPSEGRLDFEKSREKWAKANVKISKELRDIIHGYIFSDGYVTETGSLQVDQSKEQEKFVLWLYNKLEQIRTKSPISDVTRTDKRSGKQTYSKRFYTLFALVFGLLEMAQKELIAEELILKSQLFLRKKDRHYEVQSAFGRL
jgi:hypothetical protein